jgi:hypothetical protein
MVIVQCAPIQFRACRRVGNVKSPAGCVPGIYGTDGFRNLRVALAPLCLEVMILQEKKDSRPQAGEGRESRQELQSIGVKR